MKIGTFEYMLRRATLALVALALAILTACGGDPQSMATAPVVSAPAPLPVPAQTLLDPVRDSLQAGMIGAPKRILKLIETWYPDSTESAQRNGLSQLAAHYHSVLSVPVADLPTTQDSASTLMHTTARREALCTILSSVSEQRIESELLKLYLLSADTPAKVERIEQMQKLAGYEDLSSGCTLHTASGASDRIRALGVTIAPSECRSAIYYLNGVANTKEMIDAAMHRLRGILPQNKSLCVVAPLESPSEGIFTDVAKVFLINANTNDADLVNAKVEYLISRVFGSVAGVVNTEIDWDSPVNKNWFQMSYNRLQSDINRGLTPIIVAHSGGNSKANYLAAQEYFTIDRVTGNRNPMNADQFQVVNLAAPVSHDYWHKSNSYFLYEGDRVIRGASVLGILGDYWKPTLRKLVFNSAAAEAPTRLEFLGHGFLEVYAAYRVSGEVFMSPDGFNCPTWVRFSSMADVLRDAIYAARNRIGDGEFGIHFDYSSEDCRLSTPN